MIIFVDFGNVNGDAVDDVRAPFDAVDTANVFEFLAVSAPVSSDVK